ncbi:MAG: hypothetical protein JKY56_23800 [Kofleriaceae bacterium]|nr:hypothetical protein [Kofleriaceae bacterium]
MALFSHRPRLQIIDLPERFYAGRECEIVLRVHCLRKVVVSGLVVWIEGKEQARFSLESVSEAKVGGQNTGTELFHRKTLERGSYDYTAKFTLPGGFAPSYDGKRCSTQYTLHAHLQIPYWPGRKVEQDVQVVMGTPLAKYPGQAFLFSSGMGEPEAKKGYLEGSLVSDVLCPGEFLRGAIALINTQYNRYSRIRVSLVGKENLHKKRRQEEVEVRRLALDIDTTGPAEGESFPIVMQIPEKLAPSASAGLWTLSWSLEIVASIRLGRDVMGRVPLTLVDREFAPIEISRSAPRVGADRMLVLWKRVSEKCGVFFDGEKITGHHDEVVFGIAREHQGRSGMRLLGTLEYPSLGLDVMISESSRMGSWRGLSTGHKEWDKHHHVRGRSLEQMESVLKSLGSTLTGFPGVSLSDTKAEVWSAESGMKERELRDFVASVSGFAKTLSEFRASIPLPSCFAEDFDDWQQFARRLDGGVERGDMSVRGQCLGVSIAISHHWSDEGILLATEVRAHGLTTLAAGECFSVSVAEDGTGIASEDLPGAQLSTYSKLLPSARKLQCLPNELCLLLEPLSPVKEIEALAFALAKCAQTRTSHTGPYR